MTQGSSARPDSAGDDLLYRQDDGIGIITFNRPAARNALTFAMYDRLAEICRAVAADASLSALVLIGAGGRAFAAGTDISSFRDIRSPADALAYERRMSEVLDAVESCPVPTVAALAGACTGGGAAIAAACDLRIATRDLKFGFPIARTLGNCLSVASLARLTALIGAGRTREIIFTARLIGAEEALAIGLASEIVEDFAGVQARALELARTVAGHAPLTLRATKEALRRLRL
ncbi:MAG TPA: enoyl-CoA hydratase, partial [Aestuariivirgaceae bacterium]|nr:enoyl-CoA hydratase [Aestuariivirgaceae bacterium]